MPASEASNQEEYVGNICTYMKTVKELQWGDTKLKPMLHYHTDGTLKHDPQGLFWRASSMASLMVLFNLKTHMFSGRWCIVAPKKLQLEVIQETHGSCFLATSLRFMTGSGGVCGGKELEPMCDAFVVTD